LSNELIVFKYLLFLFLVFFFFSVFLLKLCNCHL
jgi:hypothetical protein